MWNLCILLIRALLCFCLLFSCRKQVGTDELPQLRITHQERSLTHWDTHIAIHPLTHSHKRTHARTHAQMALENSTFSSRPESLSLPVPEKGEVPAEETKEDVPATGVFNVSEELGHVVTTETSPPPQVPSNNTLSFQDKMAAREAQANQHRKKLQGAGQERGRFGWGKRFQQLFKTVKHVE